MLELRLEVDSEWPPRHHEPAEIIRVPLPPERRGRARVADGLDADVCRRAASVLSVGGYCRFDVRQRPSGELCILDVNPNPDIGQGTGFRKALQAAGIDFADFLKQLMIAARAA